MVTNLLTWEGARDACSNEFVFGTEKPTSTDEASSIITNIEAQVLTLFLQTAQNQMKSLSLYRKEMFPQGGLMLLPRGAFLFCLFVCL